jgi:serine/threonine-protein kinase
MFICPACASTSPDAGVCEADGTDRLATAGDALLGTRVGRFVLARQLGFGSTGAVYLGIHPGLGSRVAVKVLHHVAARDPDLIDRFERAARAANRVRSHAVAKVYDLATTADDRPAALMELVCGTNLADHLEAGAPLDPAEVRAIGLSALGALETVHAAGVVHRDLKPANLQLTPRGRVVLLDFGIAKITSAVIAEARRTRTGALLGSPHYLSPELARGEPAGVPSDIYSMGVILYEALCGEPPFAGSNLYELLHHHASTEPVPPSSRRSLDPLWDDLVGGALAKDPETRFRSARAMARALESLRG